MFDEREDYYYVFERRYAEMAVEIATRNGMTQKEFATRVFVGRAYPERAWYSVKRKPDGPPQRLTLAESMRMAEVIGESFVRFCTLVEVDLKAKGIN